MILNKIHGTEVRSCQNISKPIDVRVKDCNVPPCPLVRNTIASVDIDFEMLSDMDDVKVLVVSKALGAISAVPMPNKNSICKEMINGYCPVDKGEVLTYRLKMPVLFVYPLIDLDLKISLRDSIEEHDFVCFQIQCKVVKSNENE